MFKILKVWLIAGNPSSEKNLARKRGQILLKLEENYSREARKSFRSQFSEIFAKRNPRREKAYPHTHSPCLSYGKASGGFSNSLYFNTFLLKILNYLYIYIYIYIYIILFIEILNYRYIYIFTGVFYIINTSISFFNTVYKKYQAIFSIKSCTFLRRNSPQNRIRTQFVFNLQTTEIQTAINVQSDSKRWRAIGFKLRTRKLQSSFDLDYSTTLLIDI